MSHPQCIAKIRSMKLKSSHGAFSRPCATGFIGEDEDRYGKALALSDTNASVAIRALISPGHRGMLPDEDRNHLTALRDRLLKISYEVLSSSGSDRKLATGRQGIGSVDDSAPEAACLGVPGFLLNFREGPKRPYSPGRDAC